MAKNPADSTTLELPGLPGLPKKRGRPSTGKAAKTSTQRQQILREKDAEVIAESAPENWNVRQCIAALNRPEWRGSAKGESAWLRLGELMGYPRNTMTPEEAENGQV